MSLFTEASKQAMAEQLLPREIVVEILSRLPPNSVLRFRSVCKSWRSLIDEPSFISLHRRHSESFLLLGLWKPNGLEYHLSPLPLLTLSDSFLPLPSHLNPYCQVIATCHGLLCIITSISKESYSFVICNPSLRRFLSLPEPLLPFPHLHHSHAFGFDSRNNDYKIVRIVTNTVQVLHSRVEVYSLASGFWRTLPLDSPPFTICWGGALGSHGFVNGLVHWGAKRKLEDGDHVWFSFFVLSFDFVDELFHEVELPESVARASSSSGAIVTVVGGSNEKPLTVYHDSGDIPCTCSIWVMKEYGVVQSWNKVFHFDLTEDFCLHAPSLGITLTGVMAPPEIRSCVTNDGEKLIILLDVIPGKESLYLLDMRKNAFADLKFEVQLWDLCSDYYAETLVLLDKDNVGALTSY